MLRLLKILIYLVAILCGSVFALGLVLLDDTPALEAMAPPQPQDVEAARRFVHQVRRATEASDEADQAVLLPLRELQGILRLGTRFLPGLRTSASMRDGGVQANAALPVPWIGGQRWLNIAATIPPFEGQFRIASVVVGGQHLPPDLALRLGTIAANLVLGGETGDRIRDSASRMAIDGEDLRFTVRIDRAGRGEVISGVFGALRGGAMPPPAEIDRFYTQIRQAMDDGRLPVSGSFLPYLTFTLKAALDQATPETLQDRYTAAIFGLTKACGARDFAVVVGRLAGDKLDTFGTWRTDCGEMTLAGRIDSRLHFLTAAAIKAASTRGLALSLGEFKELNDARSGGSGFDFTDIAADNSGVRFSDLFMAQPIEAWPALIARMTSEESILIGYEGIPGRLTQADFRAAYGDVDSSAYRQVIDLIEARIDRLALHAPVTPP